jgi:hypothetical protein
MGRRAEPVSGRRRRPLFTIVWHWRKELAILALLTVLGIAVAETFGYPWLIAGLSIMAGAFSPPWSQQFRAWLWYLFTPHLLRSGMLHARLQNLHGQQPLIVRVTREVFGERVLLRCPPGVCAEDIEDARNILRAACHAADIWVTRDELRSHLVTVDVIRQPEHAGPQHGYPGLTDGRW